MRVIASPTRGASPFGLLSSFLTFTVVFNPRFEYETGRDGEDHDGDTAKISMSETEKRRGGDAARKIMTEAAKRRNGETARKPVRHFRDLDVYPNALAIGLRIYELTKGFPVEERYALTDQIRRSSRSVCANIAEAWRKRDYEAAFVAKLSDAESEAAETQVHLEFAFHHRYVFRDHSPLRRFVTSE